MAEEHFFFTPEQEADIVRAIEEAELQTSGEIRVRIEHRDGGDAYKRAVKVFEKLGMTQTAERNGILFYLATDDHRFALIGDIGIHAKVGDSFWSTIRDAMQSKFKAGDPSGALTDGIKACGKALQEHFPYQSDDVNELSDEISKGDLE